MKVLVNSYSDEIVSVEENNVNEVFRNNCYIVNVDSVKDKLIPKGLWKQLKDKDDNFIWDDSNSSILKPVKGFVISDIQEKTQFKYSPSFWSVFEILEEKYGERLKATKYENILFQEFIVFSNILQSKDSCLNIGKKHCSGQGVLINVLDKRVKEFCLDIEADKRIKLQVSIDMLTWITVDSFHFEHKFRKEASDKIYLRLDDSKNVLSAYSILY